MVIGFAFGCICSYVTKKIDLSRGRDEEEASSVEIVTVILFAYMSYCFAEEVGLSGIVALFFAGISMRHYASQNFSHSARESSIIFFKSCAFFAETLVFFYLGLELFHNYEARNYNFGLVFTSILLCILGRILNIYPLSFLATLGGTKIPWKWQLFMVTAGLRGTIAYALATDVAATPSINTTNGEDILSTTHVIVLFTVFIFGGAAEPLLGLLGLRNNAPVDASKAQEAGLAKQGEEMGISHVQDGMELQAIPTNEIAVETVDPSNSAVRDIFHVKQSKGKIELFWKGIDKKYLLPFFTKSDHTHH